MHSPWRQTQDLDRPSYRAYRQYVQFLNDLQPQRPLSLVFIALPNLVVICDMMAQIDSDNSLLKASYFGISQILVEIAIGPASGIVFGMVFALLLSPVILVASVIIFALLSPKTATGHYHSYFNRAPLHLIFRPFIILFPVVALPVLASFACKLLSQSSALLPIFGIVILCLSLVITLFSQYHSLQLLNQKNQSLMPFRRMFFPNALLEDALLLGAIVGINMAQGLLRLLLGIAFISARIAAAFFVPCYAVNLQYQSLAQLMATVTVAVGLLVAYLSHQISITLAFVLLLLVVMWRSRNKDQILSRIITSKIRAKITVENLQSHEADTTRKMGAESERSRFRQESMDREDVDRDLLDSLQKMIFVDGLFTLAFRRLVGLGSGSHSQRRELQIEVLKAKCHTLEVLSRGGTKTVNSEDVVRFESELVAFVGDMIQLCEESVSMFKLMQCKQPRRQIFANQAGKMASLIASNRYRLSQLYEINSSSQQLLFLRTMMFVRLLNDQEFVRQLDIRNRNHTEPVAHKILKELLFGEQTAVLFLNIQEDVGKIVKVSKNLPAVLGYASSSLVGQSVNQLIPFSIKPYHEAHLIRFIRGYSRQTMRRDPKIDFYAYNFDFHLQQLCIRYNFIMSRFDSFLLCGVLQHIPVCETEHILLTDYYGNLEGWTNLIGDEFNFDCLAGSECRLYNVLPLFPALVKYMPTEAVTRVKTIFFKVCNTREQSLVLVEADRPFNDKERDIWIKQLDAFQHLMSKDQFVTAYIGDVELASISFCDGHARMRKITIRDMQRIQNLSDIISLLTKVGFKEEEKVKEEESEESMQSEGEDEQRFDSNFSLDPSVEGTIKLKNVLVEQNNLQRLSTYSEMQESNLKTGASVELPLVRSETVPDNSFTPKLHRNSNMLPCIALMTCALLCLLAVDIMVTQSTNTLLQAECADVLRRNRALAIYAKTVFNPNASYVSEFDNGKLFEPSPYLYYLPFTYMSYRDVSLPMNQYYLFNSQIPATLQRIVRANDTSSRTLYYKELSKNFGTVVGLFLNKSTTTQQIWTNRVHGIQTGFVIRISLLSLGSVLLSVVLLYLYAKYRRQMQMMEAFFKFQRNDLDNKLGVIRELALEMQQKMSSWHLLSDLAEIVKSRNIANVEFTIVKSSYDPKIRFDVQQQTEEALHKRKLFTVLIAISIILVTQIVFLALHATLTFRQFDYYSTVPSDVNQAAQLLVLPNLLLANLFLPVPADLLKNARTIVDNVMVHPLQSLPDLFPLLSSAPCSTCNFFIPVLATNYRSFYSTFQQKVSLLDSSVTSPVLNDLYWAADVVEKQILNALSIKPFGYNPASLLLYILSLLAFYVAVMIGVRRMDREKTALQAFLMFFNAETLTKNKHINRLFSKDA